jgi:hypothetical protein
MFEPRGTPLLSRREYLHRQLKYALAAAALLVLSLAIGTIGYHVIVGAAWVDAVHAAAMILTGMGPAIPMESAGSKLFETAYALFSGVLFLTVSAMMLAPFVHRLLHRFHLEQEDEPPG